MILRKETETKDLKACNNTFKFKIRMNDTP